MIINNSLKTAIMSKFSKYRSEFTEEELLASEILFYKYITILMSTDSTISNNTNELINSYMSSYKNKFIELKQVYTSYLEIILFLKKIEGTNLLSIKEPEIDKVYEIYKNSKLIEPFTITSFNETIYNVNSIDSEALDYLRKIHFNVMIPIIKYYMKFYGVEADAMKIVSSTEAEGNPGKKIVFYIDGVSATRIYSDILAHRFPIEYVSAELKFPHIEIINV